MKPTLKAPGTKRLKLNCDEQLSNSAFKFNLRRYTKVGGCSFNPVSSRLTPAVEATI